MRALHEELEQLRWQVELMGLQVDENLSRMSQVLAEGDVQIAAAAITHDDAIDEMSVSLTERCYELLGRESPLAGDLRFIVSALRMLSELERIGDLSLRVVKELPQRQLWIQHPPTFELLTAMCQQALSAYRLSLKAWSAQDLEMALSLVDESELRNQAMEHRAELLMAELMLLRGDHAIQVATSAMQAGRAMERISDHAAIIGARLRYLLTGDTAHLSGEVR